jgi:hypothetical protein
MMTPVATLKKQLENIKSFEILPIKKHIQSEVNDRQRSIVVDWLFEVSNQWKLFDDTIHYAVSYMDRYLFLKHQKVDTFQLLGATCMWIAAKYNEIYPPELDDFVYIAADTYSKKSFLRMEADVLSVLNFELSKPTTKTFLMHYSNKEINYQVDLSLMSPPDSLPSTQATDILKKRKRFEEPLPEFGGIRWKYRNSDEKMNSLVVKKMVSTAFGNVVKSFA